MTVQIYVVIQAIEMCAAYLGLTVGLPLLLFRKRWRNERREGRILFSFVFGNFYVMNLVFLLQLLHISGRLTLLLGTVLPWGFFVWKENRAELTAAFAHFVKTLKWMIGGQMGFRKLAYRIGNAAKKGAKFWKRLHRISFYGVIEVLLCVGLLFALFYEYGFVILQNWGYHFSDSPVHNYWINAMCDNDLFVAGIYPQGFHAMMYYLHAVFGFETYMLLNFFSLAQTLCLFAGLLLVLRLLCRNRFAPYAGIYFFLLSDIWQEHVIMRYVGALPQEFGMLFILPAVCFGMEFFRNRHRRSDEEDGKEAEFFCLSGFAMSFAATLMIHFYNTMILAFFCIAIAIGYFRLFVKKKNFLSVVKTCAAGLGIALAPMIVCFLCGTPLEPSLNWGMEVITGSVQREETSGKVSLTGTNEEEYSGGTWVNEEFREDYDKITEELQQKLEEAHNKNKLDRYKEKFAELPGMVLGALSRATGGIMDAAFNEKGIYMAAVIWVMLLASLTIGLIRKLSGDVCYGSMQISTVIAMFLLSILVAAYRLGLPTLIPADRAAMYYSFCLMVLTALCLDGLLTFVPAVFSGEGLANGIAICTIPAVCGLILLGSGVREPYFPDLLSTNQAFACMTNILRTEEDFTWTICSADTELRMTQEHGYHTELLEFLHGMEQLKADTLYEIPTRKVFFFIEKTPLDYTEPYYGSGQQVSKPGAAIKLPVMDMGIRAYRGHSRWVCMSKLYYWMQEFERLYPTNVQVYYEDRDFVCYEVTQEPYHLFNFAIDYHFNTVVEE